MYFYQVVRRARRARIVEFFFKKKCRIDYPEKSHRRGARTFTMIKFHCVARDQFIHVASVDGGRARFIVAIQFTFIISHSTVDLIL